MWTILSGCREGDPAFVAARDGGIAAVEHLLHLGADVSKPSGQKKRTPLYIAAKKRTSRGIRASTSRTKNERR